MFEGLKSRAKGAQESDYALPCDIAAEQAVLGAIMLDDGALAKVDFLKEVDFFRKDHQLIHRALCGLIERGDACDAVTLADWFADNGFSDLVDFAYTVEIANNTPSAANIVAYAEIVAEKSRLREVHDVAAEMREQLTRPGAKSGDVVAWITHKLMMLAPSRMGGGLESAKSIMKRWNAAVMERFTAGPGLVGIPWPWEVLNRMTKGLRKATLYIVGARPSMGKSIFGLQVAVFNALRGENVAFFSVEMGGEECIARAVACVGEIPYDWVDDPHCEGYEPGDTEAMWARRTAAMQAIMESNLHIDETPTLSARQLYARAKRAHMQKPLTLIVVDHMHDMEVDPKNARFDYGIITQTGKTMAKEFRCPVILLAQLSRAAASRGDKRPVMSDLRESGEIEQKADVIIFLHREDYYDPSQMPGVVEAILAKGRNIKVGVTAYLANIFNKMRMGDMRQDDVIAQAQAQHYENSQPKKATFDLDPNF